MPLFKQQFRLSCSLAATTTNGTVFAARALAAPTTPLLSHCFCGTLYNAISLCTVIDQTWGIREIRIKVKDQ